MAQRAFEPFFTTQEFGQGAGMGLAAVYGIVRSLGGAVSLSSAPGQGTIVTIRLPQIAPPSLEVAAARPAGEAADHGPMLVVCQDRLVRRVLARMLRRESRRVVDASSLTEATELLKSPDFNVMGVEVDSTDRPARTLSWVRDHHRPGLGIITLVDPEVSESLQRQLQSYGQLLGKPFTVGELRQAVRRAREDSLPGDMEPSKQRTEG